MAIDIKELFVTDLDPNSGVWWSKDKVDKINYNFYLLSNGGMTGPQGTQGADGEFGRRGTTGMSGFAGNKGYQGVQGAGVLNNWEYFPETSGPTGLPGYLFPKKNPIDEFQSSPVALRIGYLSTETQYDVGAPLTSPIQIVRKEDNDWAHLRVEDNGQTNGYYFNFINSTGDDSFEISPGSINPNFRIICTASSIAFATVSDTNPPINGMVITDSKITVGGPTMQKFVLSNNDIDSTKFTKSKDEFKFTQGAGSNKILLSTDSFGKVEWKDTKDVFNKFPIGSIISISAEEFTSFYFSLNETLPGSGILNNVYGRGKIGREYQGWYLCNGETWKTPSGSGGTLPLQYLTPNLNNFSYTIGSNGGLQSQVTVAETAAVLIGGYDMSISAIPNPAGVYTIKYTSPFLGNTSSSEPVSLRLTYSGSGLHNASRMVHIIYLENPNLIWQRRTN
jgi:hypothetical protein